MLDTLPHQFREQQRAVRARDAKDTRAAILLVDGFARAENDRREFRRLQIVGEVRKHGYDPGHGGQQRLQFGLLLLDGDHSRTLRYARITCATVAGMSPGMMRVPSARICIGSPVCPFCR